MHLCAIKKTSIAFTALLLSNMALGTVGPSFSRTHSLPVSSMATGSSDNSMLASIGAIPDEGLEQIAPLPPVMENLNEPSAETFIPVELDNIKTTPAVRPMAAFEAEVIKSTPAFDFSDTVKPAATTFEAEVIESTPAFDFSDTVKSTATRDITTPPDTRQTLRDPFSGAPEPTVEPIPYDLSGIEIPEINTPFPAPPTKIDISTSETALTASKPKTVTTEVPPVTATRTTETVTLPNTHSYDTEIPIDVSLLSESTTLPGYVATASPISIEEAVMITLQTNPTILRASAQQLASKENIAQSRANLLPTANLTAGMGKEHTNSSSTGFERVNLNRYETTLTTSQLLWDGWGAINEVKRSSLEYQSNVYQTAEEKELTGLRATEVYLSLLEFQETIILATENVDNHFDTMLRVRARYEGGAGNKADADLAEGRLAQARDTKLTILRALQDSGTDFVRVIGVQPPKALQLPVLPAIPASLDEALTLAHQFSPALKIAQRNLEAAHANLGANKAAFLPDVTLEGTYSLNKNLDGTVGRNHELQGMLMLRYNILNGGGDAARIRQAIYNYESAKQELNDVHRTVNENVIKAWDNLVIAIERVQQLQTRVSNTEEVLEAYYKQFDLGQRSLLNVVDVERELFGAKRDLLSGQFTVMTSTYRLLAGMGVLVFTIT